MSSSNVVSHGKFLAAFAMCLPLLLTGFAQTPEAPKPRIPDPVVGRTIAKEACAACHQVLPGQTIPAPVHDADEGIDITPPTFVEIAKRYRGNHKALRNFILVPYHPMREQEWNSDDLDDVIAFIAAIP